MYRCPKYITGCIANVAVLLFSASIVFGQNAVVTHNAKLRNDPSSQRKPIRQLAPPDIVQILEPQPTNGYLHIHTVDDERGRFFAKLLRILSSAEPAPESLATASAKPVPATVATEISPDWEKPVAAPTTFRSGGQTCGPTGDGGDTATNPLKNRKDVSANYQAVVFDAVATLTCPSGAAVHRHDWTDAQLAVIKPCEGVPISVEGYIVAIKPQTSGSGQSTNCHWTLPSQVDWHVALTKNPGDGEKDAVVVETTPRVRRSHPKRTTSGLGPWKNTDAPVRISGWLMLDPEHKAHLGKYRCTLWEIHAITRIEVFSGSKSSQMVSG